MPKLQLRGKVLAELQMQVPLLPCTAARTLLLGEKRAPPRKRQARTDRRSSLVAPSAGTSDTATIAGDDKSTRSDGRRRAAR